MFISNVKEGIWLQKMQITGQVNVKSGKKLRIERKKYFLDDLKLVWFSLVCFTGYQPQWII